MGERIYSESPGKSRIYHLAQDPSLFPGISEYSGNPICSGDYSPDLLYNLPGADIMRFMVFPEKSCGTLHAASPSGGSDPGSAVSDGSPLPVSVFCTICGSPCSVWMLRTYQNIIPEKTSGAERF